MTVIDARTFTIPIQIPLIATLVAFIAHPLQAMLAIRTPFSQTWPIPATCWRGFAISLGGMIGLAISFWLLKAGRFKYSFADYHQYVEKDQVLGDYPHARREMKHELLYLLPCILGMVIGYFWGEMGWGGGEPPPRVLQAVGGSFAGYLMGGGLIWGIRILGTLGFGREAMGLGDVHLLAAIGAVVGWFDPILIFFIAPFSGLSWAFLSMGIASLFKRARRELPYGPHLAVATLMVILLRPGINRAWSAFMPNVPMAKAGLCQPAPAASATAGGVPRPLAPSP